MKVGEMSVGNSLSDVPAVDGCSHRGTSDTGAELRKRVPEGVATVLSCATEIRRTALHIHTSPEQVVRPRTGEERELYSCTRQVGEILWLPLSVFKIRHSIINGLQYICFAVGRGGT